MIDIFNITFTPLAKDSLPIAERTKENLSLVNALVSLIQDKWQSFIDYKNGTLYNIGADEIQNYNGSKIMLEYALNKQFGNGYNNAFQQQLIYIVTNQFPIQEFQIGFTELESSMLPKQDGSNEVVPNINYPITNFYNFTIKIPANYFQALGSNAMKILQSFVNKYIVAGVKYNIITY